MISHPDFPNLTAANHRITSPATSDYNCIAWSAYDTERWWQPGVYWPVDVPSWDYGLATLEQAFRALGYEKCEGDGLEVGFEKVALYGSELTYTHAARQLADGKWTSKLGRGEDIEHETPDDVAGGLYGKVAGFMKRPRTSSEPAP
jgi:hypothetical protein